jgi:hypothetical protein
MTMRFFEFILEQEPVQQVAVDATVANTKEQPPADSGLEPPVADQSSATVNLPTTYADKIAYDKLINLLLPEIKKIHPTGQAVYSKKSNRIPHLRTNDIKPEELIQILTNLGYEEGTADNKQLATSREYQKYVFVKDNVSYTIVVRGASSTKGQTSGLMYKRKDLTPTVLGITGKTYTSKQDLVNEVSAKIEEKYRSKDSVLADTLLELLEIANSGGQGKLSPQNLDHIKTHLDAISQDYAEVLTPIMVVEEGEVIDFPGGSEKLIDVTVGGKRYAVKAAGGSATSMNSLGSLLDEYDNTLDSKKDQAKKEMFHNGIKIWASTKKEGSVRDRLCLASYKNKTPEYIAMSSILGSDFAGYKKEYVDEETKITIPSLVSILQTKIANLSYEEFLKLVFPATKAGNWPGKVKNHPEVKNADGDAVKPLGLPDDAWYYLGLEEKQPRPQTAGKNSYDPDPVDGGGNIICYILGQGLRSKIKFGTSASQYKGIMTDMLRTMNCYLVYLDITKDGGLSLRNYEFSNLEFEFDYWAPSNLAGNNRPGFMYIPPE